MQNNKIACFTSMQSLAMKQLAATHRSAIRLLHSFAGMPGRPPVYQQLSELMQQLTLCCCQLGLDRTQLLELNDQMKVYFEIWQCFNLAIVKFYWWINFNLMEV